MARNKTNGSVDRERYNRFAAGQTIEQIAQDDNIELEYATTSVRNGWQMFEVQQQMRLKDMKYRGVIENEEIRSELRQRIKEQLISGLERLIRGEREVVETNRVTGEVRIIKYVDIEMIAVGIEAIRKTLSLEEKPVPNQTMINIQNNSGDTATVRTGQLSYEERLEQIQEAQGLPRIQASSEDNTPMSRQIIDTEARAIDDTVHPVDAEIVEDEKDGEWPTF